MLRWSRLVTVIAVAVGLPGCWLQVGYGPAGDSFNPLERRLTASNAATLTQAWTAPADGRQAIVAAGRVFTIDDGEAVEPVVHASRVGDGRPLWSRQVAVGPDVTITGLVVVRGELYGTWRTTAGIDCRAGELRLDPTDGSVVALTETTPTARGPAVPVGDELVQMSWSLPSAGADCLSTPTTSTLVVRDEATGDVRWRSSEIHGYVDGLPVVGDGRVYVRYGQHLVAYALDGCGAPGCPSRWDVVPTWHVPEVGTVPIPDLYGPPMFAGGSVFIAWYSTGGSGIAVLDAMTGQLTWSSTPQAAPSYGGGGLAAADGLVYVGGPGSLGVFDADGCGAYFCDPVGSAHFPPSEVQATGGTVVVAGGVVYASRSSNYENPFRATTLFAFDAQSCATGACRLLWTTDVLADAALVVSDGRLLASTWAGLIAFAPAAAQ
jgi:hypothetical protein